MVSNNVDYQGVPTGADLESNTNKYTVNKKAPSGKLLISKTSCILMTVGVFLLLLLAIVATYFLVPLINADKTVEDSGEPMSIKEASILPSSPNKKPSDTPEYFQQRLPRTILPISYKINIMPYLTDGNFTTLGEVTMELNVTDDTRKIIFYAKDLDIHGDSLALRQLPNGPKLAVSKHFYEEKDEKYTIATEEIMSKGEKYELLVKYTGYLKNNMQGFYRSSYIHTKTNQTSDEFYSSYLNQGLWLASTQFSPTAARRAFPCFDEPSFKSKFKISLARPKNMTTMSNMPLDSTTPVNNRANWEWDHYLETPLMSTYLVAFIVSDLNPYIALTREPKITVWSREDVYADNNYAGKIAPGILRYFEKKFKSKFPLPKVDIVAVPDFGFSAMENWGLITFRESCLLFNPLQSTIDDKSNIALVLSHELAHQWFGNLVTPSWWDNLWLKEGFASYYNYLGVNAVEPSWNILSEFPMEVMANAFKTDSLPYARPLSFPVKNSDQIIQAFDRISYEKGASIIRMANYALGEEIFTNAMVKYLTAHQYSNADHNDVWDALDKQFMENGVSMGNYTVSTIMNTWIQQAGYPVVSASYDSGINVLTLKQKRYFMDAEEPSNNTWYIPISCTTSLEKDYNSTKTWYWLHNTSEATFPLSTDDWYLLNLHQTGYFIVNYDDNNWKRLQEHFDKFPSHVRSQLVSDSMDLAKSGMIDYDIPLNMITYVGTKDMTIDYIPLKVSLDKLVYLRRMLAKTPIYGNFEKFVKNTFNFAFDSVTLVELPGETYRQQKIRKTVLHWTLSFDESDAMHNARAVFRDWISFDNPIRANIRTEVCCGAVRLGVDSEWLFLYHKYLNTTIPAEKSSYLEAMGCSRKQWVLSKYLNMMLSNDSGVKKQDGVKVFQAVASNPAGYQIAFDFFRTNYKAIQQHYGDGFNMVSKLVESLAYYMNTEYQLQEFIAFREEHKNELGAAKQAFDRTIQQITFNVKWLKLNYQSIDDWLNINRMQFAW